MELPTYTNIWKIEKRLYKLYDFRLPMPVPIGQVAAFLAIAIPYMLILGLVGMPFSHTWVWLYVLPPGVLAWLVTRQVLEGKRLPELVLSQARYVAEPRTWCRMAPLAEQDQIVVVARVWRGPAKVQSAGPIRQPEPARPLPSPAAPAPERPAWPERPAVGPTAKTAASAGLRVRADAAAGRPMRVVERALRTAPGGRQDGWHDRVVVVPGGHRPGKPDHVQRDQARARLPLARPARIVVLGSTAGAGQTVTTLLTGQLLASLRGEPVAVLGFLAGPGSLAELARQVPRLLPSRLAAGQSADRAKGLAERGLQVVTADHAGPEPRDTGRLIDAVVARYPITLADPAAGDIPRALDVADQLVLVTPPGAGAAGALAMTLEWLEGHGHARLGRSAVAVLNGVSDQPDQQAERAVAVAAGRCRVVVQVPWDGALASGRPLDQATVHAFTALAGVLIAGLADEVPVGVVPARGTSR